MKTSVKAIAAAALMLAAALPASAQWQRTPTPNDTLQSVRLNPDGSVTYSIYAPKARTVSLAGDAMPWGAKVETREQPNGVWSITVPQVTPGVYRYHFVVDGVQVYDPKSPTTTELTACAMVAPEGNEFFAYHPEVAHGAMAVRTYESKTLGTTRTMRVWTPAGYEKSTQKLPVLYLIHGGGDTDTSWPGAGAAGNILDNLLAEGKMKPMIVVMPNGSIDVNGDFTGEVPLFAQDMVTDIIPYIEQNYRCLTDRKNRAMAGLSMGGMETLETCLQNIDMFNYVWVLSSSFKPGSDFRQEAERLGVFEHADKINRTWRVFAFTQGGPTDIAYKNGQDCRKVFDEAGVKYEYNEVSGGHSWEAWRQNLYDLAQRLFK